MSSRTCGFKSHPGHMKRSMIERKLAEVSDEMKRVREDLRVSAEQLDHFKAEADEARIRALVSETPMVEQDFQEAHRHAETMRRHHDDLENRMAELETRQDALLDQMMA